MSDIHDARKSPARHILEAAFKLRVALQHMNIHEMPVITLETEEGMKFESALLSSNDARYIMSNLSLPRLDSDGYLSLTVNGIKFQWMPPMRAQVRIDNDRFNQWFPNR